MSQQDFGVRVCRLYLRTSKKGNVYYGGYWGDASVALLKSNMRNSKGEETWELFLSQKQSYRSGPTSYTPGRPSQPTNQPSESDDEKPF